MKKAAKSMDKDVVRIYAKSLIDSRRQVSKLYSVKASLSSLEMQMKEKIGLVLN